MFSIAVLPQSPRVVNYVPSIAEVRDQKSSIGKRQAYWLLITVYFVLNLLTSGNYTHRVKLDL